MNYGRLWMLAAASVIAGVLAPAVARADEVVQDDRMGVATHLGRPQWDFRRTVPKIREAGFGWIRDGIGWRNVEKEKGKYAIPPETLEWIRLARENNLKIIFILNAETHSESNKNGTGFYKDVYDPDAYAAFAGYVAKELAGEVEVFEILNEPANFGFSKYYGGKWNGTGDSPWVAKYVTLMNKAADAIKAANPKAKVIGLGSVAPVNFRQLALGVAPSVDGIVDHPYTFKLVPELIPFAGSPGIVQRDGIATADEKGTLASQIRMYREQSAKFHGPKELWFTEWGFSTFQPTKPQQYAGFTRNAQAKYTQRRFVECMALDVKVSVVYDFLDDGKNPHDAEHNFGIVDTELNPKPAFFAVQRVAKIMHGWRPAAWGQVKMRPVGDRPDRWPIVWDGSKLASAGEMMAYPFANEKNQQAVAIWSAERADGDLTPRVAEVEIEGSASASKVEAIDMMTETRTTLKFEKRGNAIVIKNFVVADVPVLVVMSAE